MKKILPIILVGIVCLGLGFGGAYFSLGNKETVKADTDNKLEVNEEVLEVTSDEVIDALNRFFSAYLNCGDVLKQVYFKKDNVVASDLDNGFALDLIQKEYFNNKEALTKEQIENYVKEYLGNDYKFEHKKNQGSCPIHVLDDNGNYVYKETSCGCTSGPNSHSKYTVSKAVKTGDTLKLTLRIIFPSSNYDSKGHTIYYKDVNLTEEIKDLSFNYQNSPDSSTPYENMDNFNKGGKYQMTFKEVNGKYMFVSSGIEQ